MISTASALVAAALVAAAPASQPFGMTVSPTVVRAADGGSAAVRVTDTGTAPLAVTASLETVQKARGKCTTSAVPVRGVTIAGPSSWTLQPGQHAVARIRVAPGAPAQDLAVVFAADPSGTTGNVHVTGAVGAQLLVSGRSTRPAGCSSAASRPHRLAAAAAGNVTGTPRPGAAAQAIALVVLAALLAALAAALVYLRRRWRRRRLARHGRMTWNAPRHGTAAAGRTNHTLGRHES